MTFSVRAIGGRRGSDAVGLLIREIRAIRGPWVRIGGIRMTRPRVFRDAISAREACLEVSRCAGYAAVPGLSRAAGRLAGAQPACGRVRRARGAGARLPTAAGVDLRPQELFLSGSAEGLPDLAVRPSVRH